MDSITSDFENWGPYLMKQFQQMYEKGERCDLEISCNKQIFLVHRLILSACSEYVRDLGDKQHIILPNEVSCKAVKAIIDFVYTGKIIFCKDEMEDLLLASNLLHMRLLTELIKMEESCSFTLSMDDENEESKGGENVNNVDLDLNDSTDLVCNDKFPEQIASSQTVKKKEVRGGRPRGTKHTVLPPLFKFPYLQQKFSATRTYGLITILTELVPSRLDVPEAILQNCTFQSSFDDVSYGTRILCSYDSMDAPLQPEHQQFLKKIRESPQRRSLASALFSPFDKYTPPYNMSSEMQTVKKREAVTSSYLSSIDAPATKRPALKTSQTPKKSVTFARELEVFVECPRSYPSDSPKRPPIQPPTPVEIPKQLLEIPETTAAIDVALETTAIDIDMELPAPLSPVTNISGDLMPASFADSGERIELTNLKIVDMPMEIEELDHPTVIEYQPEPSVVADNTISANGNESAPAETLPTCEDITMVDPNEVDNPQEVDIIQKDIPMATDDVESLPSKNPAASDVDTIEQITKEFEIEQQNPDVTTSTETSTEVNEAKTTAEAAVADKNETEIEVLPDTKKPSTVSVTEPSVVTSDPRVAKRNACSVYAAAKTKVKTATIKPAKTAHLSPPIIPSASEIAQKQLTTDDSICEGSDKELSSTAVRLKQPLEVEPASMQQQLENSTETVQPKLLISNQEASTSVSSSSTIPASVIATEPEVPTESSMVSSNSNSSETTILPDVEKPANNYDSSAPSISNSNSFETTILPSIIEKPADNDDLSASSTTDSNSSETTILPNIIEKPTDNDDSSAPRTSNANSSETTILPNIIKKPNDNDSSTPSTSSTSNSNSILGSKCTEEVILSDSTVFTPLDAKRVSHISTEPNSQIYAIKVKGTENQTQLSQLVDLCKKNPLFKNKNVKFKIVPVKGPISKTLQESVQLSSNILNKAIIVQKSANSKGVNAQGEKSAVAKAAISPATKTATAKGVSPTTNRRYGKSELLENVTGPWECSSCREGDSLLPLKLHSYFQYRTHLHEVHNEPNNPIFCIRCGYKSLKRNQQLFHLLSKHGIQPPPNVQFPKCDKCDFYALTEYSLQKHQASHQSAGMEYVCTCRAAFKTSDLLQQHMASNVCKNSSSFSCGYCNSQFGRVVNLKAHMRVCMKERAKLTPSNPFIETAKSIEETEMILP